MRFPLNFIQTTRAPLAVITMGVQARMAVRQTAASPLALAFKGIQQPLSPSRAQTISGALMNVNLAAGPSSFQ